MSAVSTHVLDTARGLPAADVPVRLERHGDDGPMIVAEGRTDGDGRVPELGPGRLEPGIYRIVFETATYFDSIGVPSMFPDVRVTFRVSDAARHYHLPLLLSPFAYTTYRGS